MALRDTLQAVAAVAYKELLHIVRDRRILALLLVLPPVFTLIFGHAFESSEITDTPALLFDADDSAASRAFLDQVATNKAFQWRRLPPPPADREEPDLLGNGVRVALLVPAGWGRSLQDGDPQPLRLFIDGNDTNTASELEGRVQASLGEFQLKQRQDMIDGLPAEVFDLAKQLPVAVRKQFVSSMSPWSVTSRVLYNPQERFIDYVLPGIIGLILQLITVTLTACTIAREREAGTLPQLMVTSLRRSEIVIGKMLPYLGVSVLLILVIITLAGWHFRVPFHDWRVLALICLLFLLSSLGTGLLISAFSQTQTQAIQISVFFLLPVFVLSGAFAPLDRLPAGIRYLSELFPLTHFCHAFRLANLYRAPVHFLTADLLCLLAGTLATFAGAAWLLRRVDG